MNYWKENYKHHYNQLIAYQSIAYNIKDRTPKFKEYKAEHKETKASCLLALEPLQINIFPGWGSAWKKPLFSIICPYASVKLLSMFLHLQKF
jgi:hypothetical protein